MVVENHQYGRQRRITVQYAMVMFRRVAAFWKEMSFVVRDSVLAVSVSFIAGSSRSLSRSVANTS